MAQRDAVWLSDGLGMIDLQFWGENNLIAAYVIETSDGLVVIETGPANAADRLLEGIQELGLDPADLRHIAVTHIHLDHAGAAGALLRQFPDTQLYVHRIGAPHMIDPSRLLQSAGRIYGDQMDALWGVMQPVPAERVTTIDDGDTLQFGDLKLDVLYTPGHASHHASYVDGQRGVLFSGDVAGVRIPPSKLVWPPTPPPDIDIEVWHQSIAKLRRMNPEQLLLTHFGPFEDVAEHLDQLNRRLDRWTNLISEWQRKDLERQELVDRLTEDARAEMQAAGESTDVQGSVSNVTPFGMAIDGMTRYLKKRSP